MTITTKDYMALANRTNKAGSDIDFTSKVGSALLTQLPNMIDAAYSADRIKASLVYGAKLREVSHVACQPVASPKEIERIHAALGIFSEGGEVLEMFHDAFFNNVPIDEIHMAEELGDLMWFIVLMAKNIGYSLDDIMTMNINKLASRYSAQYSDLCAINRDLGAEREAIETTTD